MFSNRLKASGYLVADEPGADHGADRDQEAGNDPKAHGGDAHTP